MLNELDATELLPGVFSFPQAKYEGDIRPQKAVTHRISTSVTMEKALSLSSMFEGFSQIALACVSLWPGSPLHFFFFNQ